MPNHVTNSLFAPAHVIDALLDEDGHIDFNLIVPQPENIERGGCSGEHPPGVPCWYIWNTTNWGTKWNGYETDRVSDELLTFETAWSTPIPIFEALAAKFPDEEFSVKWADEDLGYNCGTMQAADGDLSVSEIQGGSEEANEFASQLRYGMTYADVRREIWGLDEE